MLILKTPGTRTVNAAGGLRAAQRISGCLRIGTPSGPANRSLLARN